MYSDFGSRLITLIRAKGLNNKIIATSVNVSEAAAGRWVMGGKIKHENLVKLAKVLNVSWVWLLYGDSGVVNVMRYSKSSDCVSHCNFCRLKYRKLIGSAQKRRMDV